MLEEDQMKKTLILALGLSAVSFQAQAISRYETPGMSCDQVQAAVARDGVAILRYRSTRNPSLPLYDRYVANESFCPFDEYAQLATVPASDTGQCRVLKCKQRTYEPFGDN
jgi:hypothetical protein